MPNKHINLTNHDSGRRLETEGSSVVCRLRARRWAERGGPQLLRASRIACVASIALALLVALTSCASSAPAAGEPNQGQPSSVSPASADPQPLAARFHLHITGEGSLRQWRLPERLTDANWGLKQEVVSESGYDLRPYAGQRVTLVCYPIRERYRSDPLYLWLVESDGAIVGAYATVREGSTLAPGVFSLSEVGGHQ
jgi:hypothetical protein